MATGNTEGKGSAGGKFRPPPATVWNNMVDAGRAWADSQLDSPGGPPTRPRATDIIKIQNTSGAARRTGEVLKIEGKALDTITAEHIWLMGVEPTEDCYFGILRKPVADDGVEQLQVSGACLALVDIQDVTHTRANVVEASYVLESSDSGPLEILYGPETTGEQTCVVRFSGGSGGTHEVWATIVSAECEEYTNKIEYVMARPKRGTSGRTVESVPDRDNYGLIRVVAECPDEWTAFWTKEQLEEGKILRATYMWDFEAETPIQRWYLDGVCGQPECA